MHTAGIVAEYNPFHTGHAWHIARTRELLGGEGAVVAAGAVVLSAIPANATAVGVPARVVRVNGEKVNHCSDNLDQIHVADPLSQCLCQMQPMREPS